MTDGESLLSQTSHATPEPLPDLQQTMLSMILQRYPWSDHPEGMKFAEIYQNEHRSAGHWLFLPGAISVFHQVHNCDEIWAIHSGCVHLHVIDLNGVYSVTR